MRIKTLEDIYNIHGKSLDDYAWLSQDDINDYLYCDSGSILEIDIGEDLAYNDSCSIPFGFIKENIKYEYV